MLPTDDQTPPETSSGIPAYRPRVPSAPIDELLKSKLASVKDDVDSNLKSFFTKPPSGAAAKRLVEKMTALFNMIDEIYLPQADQGRRTTLKRVRKALRLAAIGTGRLIAQKPSIKETAAIHEELLKLGQELADVLRAYKSPGE